jgi:hypothetical protein
MVWFTRKGVCWDRMQGQAYQGEMRRILVLGEAEAGIKDVRALCWILRGVVGIQTGSDGIYMFTSII